MIEAFWGVNVIDDAVYAEYRKQMIPILTEHGGAFVIDVRVSEVLRAPVPGTFNRMFSIRFPSEAKLEEFFANARYKEVRAALFTRSVNGVVELGRFSR